MDRTNELIKWAVIAGDFLLLNLLLHVLSPYLKFGNAEYLLPFFLICNLSLLLSEYRFHTIIHQRLISAGDVLRRIILLVLLQCFLAYGITKATDIQVSAAYIVGMQGLFLFFLLLFARFFERLLIKRIRLQGKNVRTITFVGSDRQLLRLYDRLVKNSITGYKLKGYYADERIDATDWKTDQTGTIEDLIAGLEQPSSLDIGDELYVCLPRHYGKLIQQLSRYCDESMKRFFYVLPTDDLSGIKFHKTQVTDLDIYTTHEMPLNNSSNKCVKRLFDICFSVPVLLVIALFFPIIALIIKIQSPGPVLFKQVRTGMDGKDFVCYKFRSMHLNRDADSVQATRSDVRKFPFGAFMRKTSIDELPQFWNVFCGDMSVVGPRPHMLAHTAMYRKLIGRYMVRHFVKPGITGLAQISGYRGETKELWQMEGRVERDIWYIENWSIWLDLCIIWVTFKSVLSHDDLAY